MDQGNTQDDDDLWNYTKYGWDPDWQRLWELQSDFAALHVLGNLPILPYDLARAEASTERFEDGQELVTAYGPLWRRARVVWSPVNVSEGYLEWNTRQVVLLVRSDLIIESEHGWHVSDLSQRIRRAVAEALQLWARREQPPVADIASMIDDFSYAVRQIPNLGLWEAGVVPVIHATRQYFMDVDPYGPWIPDDFTPYEQSIGDAHGAPEAKEQVDER